MTGREVKVEIPQLFISGCRVEVPWSVEPVKVPQSTVTSGAVEVPQSTVTSGVVEVPQSTIRSGVVEVPQSTATSGVVRVPQSVVLFLFLDGPGIEGAELYRS